MLRGDSWGLFAHRKRRKVLHVDWCLSWLLAHVSAIYGSDELRKRLVTMGAVTYLSFGMGVFMRLRRMVVR